MNSCKHQGQLPARLQINHHFEQATAISERQAETRSLGCLATNLTYSRTWAILFVIVVANALFISETRASIEASDAEILFVRRVMPLIREKCSACHGALSDKIEGSLNLLTLAGMTRGGDSGEAAIVLGQPNLSPLVLASGRNHQDWSSMPPKESERLSSEQLGWLREWIQGGAPWPSDERQSAIAKSFAQAWSNEDGITVVTSGGLSSNWTERRYKMDGLWAYQPILKPVVAATSDSDAIDELISKRIPKDLRLAPAADARNFLRRATLDLTGLPPTPLEVDAFERDFLQNSDQAVSQLIDRLLSSPHYGERMAQNWLDVVRYADSSGFANDFERGNAWRYRDYVVRAFNQDMPYDRFVREQIAGDEIDPNDPEKLIATGFLRMGPWELTGMEVAKIARQRFLDDVTNSVGETFLAQSLQCARCHDHKFDPIPTRDYYAVQAVFATTQLVDRPADFLNEENIDGFDERRYLELRAREHERLLEEVRKKVTIETARAWFQENGRDASEFEKSVEAIAGSEKDQKNKPVALAAVRKRMQEEKVHPDLIPPPNVGFTPKDFGNERIARKGLERLKWEFDRYEPFALAVYSGRTPQIKSVFAPIRMPSDPMNSGDLEESCIRIGGDPFAVGEPVQPGVLSLLNGVQLKPIPTEISQRRLAFAEWVANDTNPLTLRTVVNRIWMWHFGDALAGNPNNFGSTGKRPTHPELLDWLAATFVEKGWSFKSMHRLIMNSQAYRRSAQHPDRSSLTAQDPLGTSYAVFKPRRLTAEEIRDAILSATGELNRTLGGIPNRPEINVEAALQPRQVMGTFAAAWTPNPQPKQRHRRSLYTLKLRGLADPALEVFNAPSPDFSCERREVSLVTPQVFSLFNGTASYSRALALASRVTQETSSDEAAIDRLFKLVYSRLPQESVRDACLEHWREMEALQTTRTYEATKLSARIVREAVEENTGEKFSFEETLYANLDFVPDLQPSEVDAKTRALADVCLVLFNSNEFAYVY
jgi:hypothetical protein